MNETQLRKVFDRRDILLALLAGGLSLALYARTLASWVLPGDGGEFQVLAWQVGEAHTTGYPVYILLAKVFLTLIPIGSIAYRINLFSAFMGALTVAGVYLCSRLLVKSRLAALGGAAALAVSFTFWSQSVIAEVYTAGAAFAAGIWLALLIWDRTGSRSALFAAGLIGGLGLGVHGTIVLLVPPILIYLFLHRSRWGSLWKPAFAGGLAGALLFLACFLVVDRNAPPANSFNVIYGPARSVWGLTEADIENPVARMKYLITAGQWSGEMFANPEEMMPRRWMEYRQKLNREFSGGAILLAILGLILVAVRNGRAAILFAAALMAHWIFYFNYNVGDIYVFYIPGYFWIAVLVAAGLGGIASLVDRIPRRSISRIAVPAVVTVVGLLCILPVWSPHAEAVREGQVPFLNDEEFGAISLADAEYPLAAGAVRAMERDAIVLADWQQLWGYWYAATFDERRPDLRFVEMNPYHRPPGFPASTIEFIRDNIGAHPVYLWIYSPEVAAAGFDLHPVAFGSVTFFKVEI